MGSNVETVSCYLIPSSGRISGLFGIELLPRMEKTGGAVLRKIVVVLEGRVKLVRQQAGFAGFFSVIATER